mmetsp:Transcript_6413/g.18820  ORF Transcript_6413/g.18820 Transcript_6413/m.18820 type:complete len:237 (-) Transcript_6413:2503-3213(-)
MTACIRRNPPLFSINPPSFSSSVIFTRSCPSCVCTNPRTCLMRVNSPVSIVCCTCGSSNPCPIPTLGLVAMSTVSPAWSYVGPSSVFTPTVAFCISSTIPKACRNGKKYDLSATGPLTSIAPSINPARSSSSRARTRNSRDNGSRLSAPLSPSTAPTSSSRSPLARRSTMSMVFAMVCGRRGGKRISIPRPGGAVSSRCNTAARERTSTAAATGILSRQMGHLKFPPRKRSERHPA